MDREYVPSKETLEKLEKMKKNMDEAGSLDLFYQSYYNAPKEEKSV